MKLARAGMRHASQLKDGTESVFDSSHVRDAYAFDSAQKTLLCHRAYLVQHRDCSATLTGQGN